MSRPIQCIVKNIKELQTNPLDSHGIYPIFNENDIFNLKVLMIGPPDTPYHNGFFFFDINIAPDHPLSPPKVKFCTLAPGVRFNPNLYVEGKVCLSIINTWSGPGWSPCNTISSLLVAIKASVFVEFPLENEPGYEGRPKAYLLKYNDVIYHETFRVAIIGIVKKRPNGFSSFDNIVAAYFAQNFQFYLDRCLALHYEYKSKLVQSPIFGMSFSCNYKFMLDELLKLAPSDYIGPDSEAIASLTVKIDDLAISNNSTQAAPASNIVKTIDAPAPVKSSVKCKGTFKNGKPCTYFGYHNGWCAKHKLSPAATTEDGSNVTLSTP
jgi:ubiquitin-protein ligase